MESRLDPIIVCLSRSQRVRASLCACLVTKRTYARKVRRVGTNHTKTSVSRFVSSLIFQDIIFLLPDNNMELQEREDCRSGIGGRNQFALPHDLGSFSFVATGLLLLVRRNKRLVGRRELSDIGLKPKRELLPSNLTDLNPFLGASGWLLRGTSTRGRPLYEYMIITFITLLLYYFTLLLYFITWPHPAK